LGESGSGAYDFHFKVLAKKLRCNKCPEIFASNCDMFIKTSDMVEAGKMVVQSVLEIVGFRFRAGNQTNTESSNTLI